MNENIFYRETPTKKGMKEFNNGSRLAREKIASHPSAIKTAYKKVEELSMKDLDSLSLEERGYISKVVDSKLRKKGGVLDAYKICLNTGVIYDISKHEIEKNLIKDVVDSSLKYMNLVKSFIDKNKIAKINFLEIIVHETGRKYSTFK